MIIPLHSINDRNISLPNFDTIIKGSEVVPIDLLSSHCWLSIQFYRKVPRARKLPTVLRNQYCIVANGKCQSRYYSFRLKALFHYCIDFIPSLCFSCWLYFLPTLPIYFVMCGGICLLYFPNIEASKASSTRRHWTNIQTRWCKCNTFLLILGRIYHLFSNLMIGWGEYYPKISKKGIGSPGAISQKRFRFSSLVS